MTYNNPKEKHQIYYLSPPEIMALTLTKPTRETVDLIKILGRYIKQVEKKPRLCLLCDDSATSYPAAVIVLVPVDRSVPGQSHVFSLCPKCGQYDRTADIIKKLADGGCQVSVAHQGTPTRQ
jgi:hypothetical protein